MHLNDLSFDVADGFLRLPKLYSLLPGGLLEAEGVGFLSFSTI